MNVVSDNANHWASVKPRQGGEKREMRISAVSPLQLAGITEARARLENAGRPERRKLLLRDGDGGRMPGTVFEAWQPCSRVTARRWTTG